MSKKAQSGGDPHTTPQAGDKSVQTPDEHWPYLPETDYHHDQGADARRSPGPYAGDDLVSQQEDARIRKEQYIVDEEPPYTNSFPAIKAVDVRVVETNKTVKITHLLTSIHIPSMQTRLIPKDPTRTRLKLHEYSSQGCYIVTIDPTGMSFPDNLLTGAIWQLPQQVGATGTLTPFETDSEEQIMIYNSGNGNAIVQSWAEYQRGVETREEYYDGR